MRAVWVYRLVFMHLLECSLPSCAPFHMLNKRSSKGNRWAVFGMMALLVIFPWIVAGIIANLQLGQRSSWHPPQPITPPAEESNKSTLPQTGTQQYLASPSSGYIEYVGVAVCAALACVAVWRLRRRDAKREDWYVHEFVPTRDPFTLVVAVGLIVFTFYGMITLVKYLPNLVQLGYAPARVDVSGYLAPIAISGIFACSSLGLFLFFRSRGSSQAYSDLCESEISEEAQKFASVLDETVYALRTGNDYRDAIIGCYRALCAVLERGGVPNKSSLTAREFEALATSKINLSSGHLHEATLLFEKARYSEESVSEEEAKRSIECLEKLRDDIAQRTEATDRMEGSND